MFEDFREAEEMLRRRTSKILGGYVSEKLFLDTFILPHHIPYTKGWWLSKEKNGDRLWFFVVKNTLSTLDHRIIDLLQRNHHDVYQISCQEDRCVIVTGETQISFDEFLVKNRISMGEKRNHNTNTDPMLDRCIRYFYESGMLTDIARSIYIEDSFLNKNFYTTNIDLFLEDPSDGNLACIELKFKNEFSIQEGNATIKVFGEDVMQYETLFPMLKRCGIDVYNCILYNHTKEKHNTSTTDIFHFLEHNGGNFYWKKKKFEDNETHSQYEFPATYTSWLSNAGRRVYCIPLREYTAIQDNFFQSSFRNYWGICPKCKKGNLVLRCKRDGTGEFFGCTNYMNHQNKWD